LVGLTPDFRLRDGVTKPLGLFMSMSEAKRTPQFKKSRYSTELMPKKTPNNIVSNFLGSHHFKNNTI